MGLLRSDEMAFAQLILPPHEAKRYVEAIGLNPRCNVQFEDTFAKVNAHSGQHRPYLKPIQRVKELERILRTFTDPTTGLFAKFAPGTPLVTCEIDAYLKRVNKQDSPLSLDVIEQELKSFDVKMSAQLACNADLELETELAKEELEVLKRAVALLGHSQTSLDTPLLQGTLNSIAGVINASEVPKLKRSLWRASRGKAFLDAHDIQGGKSVFVVYFQGSGDGTEGALMGKVRRISQNSGAHLCPWPESNKAAREQQENKEKQISSNKDLLDKFRATVHEELKEMLTPINDGNGGNSKIEDYRLFCMQQKSTFGILNLFESEKHNMRCNIWYSTDPDEVKALNDTLEGVAAKDPAILLPDQAPPVGVEPPTYIKTNDFTEPWQAVVDTYGVPNYKTANPAMVTTVTFPFVFGMMYGDVGHGSILFLAGVCMCLTGDKFKYAAGYAQLIHWARYMILMMGFFAVFAGFMYNDLFGMVSLPLATSRWECVPGEDSCQPVKWFNKENLADFKYTDENGSTQAGYGPYPFGLDHQWDSATNMLLFNNSLKMKLSVLIGVLQMLLGVFLKFANSFYDKNMLDVVCECIPMLIFMLAFFGYMDYMIVYKWTHVIPGGAPGIINSLIVMAMHEEDTTPLYTGSTEVATSLMLATVVSVPWILLPKPLILWCRSGKKSKTVAVEDAEAAEPAPAHGGHGHGGEFNFSEIMIHQIIETIEYVLGTVSHTASYLRVWALSLAHQQLSLVFYTKTIQMGFQMCVDLSPPVGAVIIYFLFGAWFLVTVAVLMAMDVLECFLHTLRLHWVEFQSKFYTGKNEGIKFAPFDIIKTISVTES